MRSKLSDSERSLLTGIKKLVRNIGEDAFVERVTSDVKVEAARQRLDVNLYLDRYKARGDYRRAFLVTEKKVADYREAARVIDKLGLRIKFELPLPPWDRLTHGSAIVVVVGERPMRIHESSECLESRAVGGRDVEALAHLSTMLGRDLPVDFRVEVRKVRSDLPDAEARAVLEGLCARKDVGGVIVVGSPVVNPVADPIARKILDGNEALLPGKFRWSHPIRKRIAGEPPPFLWDANRCDPAEEGFRLRLHEKTTYLRVPDSIILAKIQQRQKEQRDSARPLRRKFKDCGIFMIDCRNRDRQILGLLAGHGGCGTIAATLALREHRRVGKVLEQSKNPQLAVIGEDRVFGVVEVDRRKPTLDPVDDLEFDFEKGKGWDWVV